MFVGESQQINPGTVSGFVCRICKEEIDSSVTTGSATCQYNNTSATIVCIHDTCPCMCVSRADRGGGGGQSIINQLVFIQGGGGGG